MTDTSGSGSSGTQAYAELMDVTKGQIVQEVGWDDDCDSEISESLEDAIGDLLVGEDTDEICDVVLLWWRADDGDLVDGLVDAIRPLAEDGCIWLLTPALGDKGSVEPGIISESAQLAGLVQTSAERLGDWQGSRLVPRGTKK